MNYGTILKELRERVGLTIIEASKIIKVSDSLYSRYEKEKQTIPLKHLNTLANYYEVSIDYLLGFTKIKKYKNIRPIIDRKTTGIRLKEFRKENKLTQVKLAEILNTVHPVLVNYENGKNLITTAFLYDLCKKYKISADYLLGRTNEPIKYTN